jgi:acetyl-CoA carboxylase biotin carboxyl carrier protein
MVGVFYHAREPGAEPFVTVGSVVAAGQQVGIVEAMKLMIPVEASRGGRVTAILKANGEPVEYDEPLFAVQPEAAG